GLLAAIVALRNVDATVYACDRSAAAVASTAATLEVNGLAGRVVVTRDNAGDSLLDDGNIAGQVDLIVCNPPFHDRASVTTDAAHRMFTNAGRLLRPGGNLWCVYNSMLRYRPALERAVGPTVQISRSPKFTVTRSVKTR
ncbi:MAG: methyltransferase, partial [Cellulomonadaceae bacterium]|nr:methyltransferase [Cellulomonadaceae bacterium]